MPVRSTAALVLQRTISAIVVMAMGVAGLVGLASPASAANTVTVTALPGTVGVSQTVQAAVASDAVGAPSGTVTFTANDATIGSQAVGGALGSTATVTWVPASAGSIAVKAVFVADDASTVSDTATVTIAKVGSSLAITSTETTTTSTPVDLTAKASSTQGSYVPTGNVTFYLKDGNSLGRVALNSSGVATLRYSTPATEQTLTYYAVYDGDTSADNSRSADATLKLTAKASTVALTVPATNYVGQNLTLAAKITPTTGTGTVQFFIADKLIGSAAVSNATATFAWKPTAVGTYTATARYGGGSGVAAGSATARVVVTAQQKVDVITVDPVGVAPAWKPGSTTVLPNGSSTPLAVSAVSKNKVTLSVVGPCALSGNSIVIKGVGGSCQLTARTTAGNGYASVTQTYTIIPGRGTQTAKVVAPANGTYRVGQRLRLGRLSATTNIGKQVTWKVRPKYKSKCRVYMTKKNYKIKMKSPGTCVVVGKAPAVSGQWSQFKVVRTYRIVR